jgi:hypothetical protein
MISVAVAVLKPVAVGAFLETPVPVAVKSEKLTAKKGREATVKRLDAFSSVTEKYWIRKNPGLIFIVGFDSIDAGLFNGQIQSFSASPLDNNPVAYQPNLCGLWKRYQKLRSSIKNGFVSHQ